ncbi:MAG: PilZ domain-containing protein [Phycisphaerae bacterium]|nr:PilZ domain-containing protein [Phycisphaerae bacterium]
MASPGLQIGGTPERRRHPRLTVSLPCKLATGGVSRFAFARTQNVSQSGALLEMDFERPINPGDRLNLAVAWRDQAVIPAHALREAKVIRVSPVGQRRHIVAVEFLRPALSAAA